MNKRTCSILSEVNQSCLSTSSGRNAALFPIATYEKFARTASRAYVGICCDNTKCLASTGCLRLQKAGATGTEIATDERSDDACRVLSFDICTFGVVSLMVPFL